MAAVLGPPATGRPTSCASTHRGKREGFFTDDPDVNAFLDEALTWRDVGFHWHWTRRQDTGAARDGAAAVGARDPARARGRPARVHLLARGVGGGRHARPALERGPARAGGDRHHPQLPADAVGQEGDRVVAHARGGVRDARAPQQQVRARRPRPELVHGHPLVLRPVRPAVGARAEGARHRALHVVREHGEEVPGAAVPRLRGVAGERALSPARPPRTRPRAAGRGRRGRARRPRGARPTPRGSRRRPTSRRTRARARRAR